MEQRLTELEIKVSYLEKSFDELSQVVRELFARLSAVEKECRRTRETAEAPEAPRSLADEKPPHF